ncbi:polysaccharide deacetylase family protein [Ruminococcus gauvreauii]|uniref:polysaccharide deacetylase family protein n=1 Tax=Ruminococcus gauvreauii TaxID=438033 RepID=UPI0039841526
MGENLSRKEQKRRKQKKRLMVKSIILLVLLVILGGSIWVLAEQMKGDSQKGQEEAGNEPGVTEGGTPEPTEEAKETTTEAGQGDKESILAEAELLAAQYDYDAAIAKLQEVPNAANDSDVAAKTEEYEATKASCVPVNIDQVTHIFYHSLVVDPDKCFGNPDDPLTAGFNQWMTTVSEFNKITQSMYDNGYVMVRLRDLVNQTTDADGTVHFTKAEIMLPPGKKAFVLSLDDLSYYHSYDGRGIASRIVLDDNGKPTCEYIEDDGTVTTGAYDVVPLMDQFLAEHPDASYRGAKGIIALTGYNGILGYRTDGVYESRDPEHLGQDQKAWLDAHPDFNYEEECAQAKKVADAMKEDGWEFASHTWGHRHIAQISLDDLKADTEKWETYVSPLVGGTDTIIFAHGEDLGDWHDYAPDNEKFNYLKSEGYNFFCNVDSTQYFVQVRDNYVRQGRRNLDGYRLYQDKIMEDPSQRKTADLFDAAEVYDTSRPNVPEL